MSDILERLAHPEREQERRKMSRMLYIRNVLNSIFIILAVIAMIGIGLSWGDVTPSWCLIIALIAVIVKMAEAALRMPSMLRKPQKSKRTVDDEEI
ncbi:MAG: hypothetical protein MSS61_03620 [Bacteroidales bacterium]|nr:hypothetical protein [Bacteroidales bacterium]